VIPLGVTWHLYLIEVISGVLRIRSSNQEGSERRGKKIVLNRSGNIITRSLGVFIGVKTSRNSRRELRGWALEV